MSKPILTTGAVILDQDQVLLVRHGEAAEHLTASWGLPAGRVEAGESLLQACVREAHEETGLVVRAEDFLRFTTPRLNVKLVLLSLNT
jgi:ADP-ribose pyrophosphatase YjhB (NUDIX family)